MSFLDISIKTEYRSLIDDMVNDFYTPLLNEATIYKRAVGFFSSSALIEISKGISGLIKNGGKIQLVASPKLSEEDIEAIEKGFEKRKEIIENCIERSFEQPKNIYEERRLNLLANLIANGQLDIKIAFLEEENSVGMFHEKMGLMTDTENNMIAFTGSMNESKNAFSHNYESIDVFCSWTHDKERVLTKESAFASIWGNCEPHIKTIDFPKVAKDKLQKYKKDSVIDTDIDHDENQHSRNAVINSTFFRAPQDIQFYDYQKDAVNNWSSNNFNGIFDMATGSGKTYTALYGLCRLSELLKEQLCVVIIAPYQHLVEQWVEDIEDFGVKPIICYSNYAPKWKEYFGDAVNAYNSGVINNFCVIATNATFSTDDFQKHLKKIKKDYCFVVDEAHNFGSKNLSKLLPNNAKFRLALSATIERFRDPEGTKELYSFFGDICKSFTLADAIQNHFLTPYYYHPVLVTLTDKELEEYQNITLKIIKCGGASEENCRNNPTVELLLLQRARIVAGAHNKVQALLAAITPFKEESHMLVYCGATKYDRQDIDDCSEVKQIEEITKELYKTHKMKVRKFTSEEDKAERAEIKELFTNGDLQVITAIKCLDEGVNIPAIKKAFILASSTNPKEYIQRRGRVLRKAKGKEFAEIFDFITIPREISELQYCDSQQIKLEISLVKKEIERMMDFAETSRNPWEIDSLRSDLLEAYGVYLLQEGEDNDE